MRVSIRYVVLAAAVAAAGTAGAAQVRIVEPAMSGDMVQLPGGRQIRTGTGQIRGRVLNVETGGPIRRAQVRISGQEILPKVALTDVEGRFEFRELPAGRFTIQASKSGFVSIQYGQTRPFESGRPIELADKQVLDNSDIYMPRGSVIAGRIVDEFGDPVPDVAVTALRQTWSNGRRRLTPAPGRMAQTNDLGQYRIYGLPPGDYYVSASMRNSSVEMVALEMAAVRGFTAGAPASSTPTSGYAPTYYPGTPNGSEAQRITLIAGQENAGADFALVPVRLAKVTGIVLSADGKPTSGAMVNLLPRSTTDFILAGHPTGRTNQDGAFTLNGVAPGDYLLQVNTVHVITQQGEGGNTMVFSMRTGPGGSGADAESASLPVVVAGEDVANLVVTTAKGGQATGKVTFEGSRPQSLGNLRVTAQSVDAGPAISFGFAGGSGSGAVKPDGTFELTGLTGPRLLRVFGAPPGWTLQSVRYNGVDITDTGAEFRPGESVSGLEVVLTNSTTTVSGGVTAADGTPVKDYTVVIFADQEELWRMPMTRWVTGSRPDQEGRFKVQNLPPGSYHAVAVEYIPSGEWGDPELLARLKGRGERFTLSEGGTPVLDLKLTSGY